MNTGKMEQRILSQEEWSCAKKSVTIAGNMTLKYVETGTADGEPLILIHGYMDTSRSWSLLAPYLAERRIIALDLRGHGASDAPASGYGLVTLAADVDAFMQAIGLERADIAGHSLGSMIAAILAAYFPQRVGHLVLISTAVKLLAGGDLGALANVAELAEPLDPDGELLQNLYWNPTPVDPDFLDRARAEAAQMAVRARLGVVRNLLITDWTSAAKMIQAPVMIVWGEKDTLFPAAIQEENRQLLPQADFAGFAGVGHNLLWEIPEKIGETITAFLPG